MPDEIVFQTKPQIALDQLRAAHAAGIAAETMLADAGYGNDTDFHDGITEIGVTDTVGINPSTTLWPARHGTFATEGMERVRPRTFGDAP